MSLSIFCAARRAPYRLMMPNQPGRASRCNKALRHVTMLAVQAAINAKASSRAQNTYKRLAEHKPKATAKVAAGRELLRDVFFLGKRGTAA